MTMRIPSIAPTLNSAASHVGNSLRTIHRHTLKASSQKIGWRNPPRNVLA